MFSIIHKQPTLDSSNKSEQRFINLFLKNDVISEKKRQELRSKLKTDNTELYSFLKNCFPELQESIKNEFLQLPMPEDDYESEKADFSRYYVEELFPEIIYSEYSYEYDESLFSEDELKEYSLGLLLLVEVYIIQKQQ